MGSTRLPGKSMLPLAGKPLIARLIERVKRCKLLDEIVLATTDLPKDDQLADIGTQWGVSTFRGSESDLVDRYYSAARAFHAGIIVRIPGDNPAPEPKEVDRVIQYHLESKNDFSSSYPDVVSNGYPDGIGAEVFNFDALQKIWSTETDARRREHIHLNFYEQPDKYQIGVLECPSQFRRPEIVLDVNTKEEYEFLSALYDYLYPRNPDFHIGEIIEWYDKVYLRGSAQGSVSSSL